MNRFSWLLALWAAFVSPAHGAEPHQQTRPQTGNPWGVRGSAVRLRRAAEIRAVRHREIASRVTTAQRHETAMLHALLTPTANGIAAYGPYQRIAFLADGEPRHWVTLAEPVAATF